MRVEAIANKLEAKLPRFGYKVSPIVMDEACKTAAKSTSSLKVVANCLRGHHIVAFVLSVLLGGGHIGVKIDTSSEQIVNIKSH